MHNNFRNIKIFLMTVLFCLMAVLCMSICAQAEPIAYYSFDDPNDLGKDNSGNGYDMAPINDPQYSANGVFNGAVEISRLAESYLYVDVDDFGTNTFSMSFWAKAYVDDLNTYAGIFASSPTPGVDFQITVDDSPVGDKGYWFRRSPTDYMYFGLGSPETILDWHHMVLVADGTEYRLYLDGVETNSKLDSTPIEFKLFKVGENRNGVQHFEGLIDDFAYWDVAITDQEILDVYNNGVGNTNIAPEPSGLMILLLLGGVLWRQKFKSYAFNVKD